MKKKMRKYLLKKSFVTLLAVSVLSTSISITAFAEEENPFGETAMEEEVVDTDDSSYDFADSSYDSTESYDSDSSESEWNIIDLSGSEWDVPDDIYNPGNDSSNTEVPSYVEHTVTVNYFYTTDGLSYSSIKEPSYMTTEFFVQIPIPKTLPCNERKDYTYTFSSTLFVNGKMHADYFDEYVELVFNLWDNDVVVDICYFLEEEKEEDSEDQKVDNKEDQIVDDSYDVTVKYMYSLPSDPYTYLEFAGSEFEKIYNDHLVSKTSVKMNYFPSDMYGYGYGTFVNDFAVTDLSSYGFKSYNMIVPFEEGFTEYGEQGTFSALPFLDQLYLTRESENVITIIYNLKEEETSKDTTEDSTETIVPEEPTVDTEIPAEPEEDTVVPTEPIVDTVTPEEPTAPAPAEPVAPVVPALVESAPIVVETGTFPPMVEEVDAPAFVFPTLLEAAGEIMELIPDEELPLANIELKKTETPMGHIHMDPHLCNILSLLLLLAVAFVVYSYTQMAKKHEERIYELKLGYRY